MRTHALLLVLPALACMPSSRKGGDPVAPPVDSIVAPAAPEVTDGPMVVKGSDGRVRMEGNIRNGQRHGVWTSYHPGGTMQSRSAYVDGQLNGVTVVFHPNGQLYYTGEHHLGKQAGDWRFYDDQGALVKTVHYDSTGTVINDR